MTFAALDIAREAAMAATMAISIASGPANDPDVGPNVTAVEMSQMEKNVLIEQVRGVSAAPQAQIIPQEPQNEGLIGGLFNAVEKIAHDVGEVVNDLSQGPQQVAATQEIDELAVQPEDNIYTAQATFEMQNPALSSGPSMA